jgi:flavoprotein
VCTIGKAVVGGFFGFLLGPVYAVGGAALGAADALSDNYQCCNGKSLIPTYNLPVDLDDYDVNCRTDICTDVGGDCCAPDAEARGCSIEGYTAVPDKAGTSGDGECVSTYG